MAGIMQARTRLAWIRKRSQVIAGMDYTSQVRAGMAYKCQDIAGMDYRCQVIFVTLINRLLFKVKKIEDCRATSRKGGDFCSCHGGFLCDQ